MNSEKDKLLESLIGQSELKMPFPDFDQKVMESIRQSVSAEKERKSMITKSWFFFVIGLLLGSAAPVLVKYMQFPENINPQLVTLVIQIIISLIFLFVLERLISVTFRRRKQ